MRLRQQQNKCFILKERDFIIRKNIVILLALNLCFQSFIFAEEKISVGDRIVGSTFKTLAKAFVVTADIDKLKKNNIDTLNKMHEEKFKRRFKGVYKIIKDLPAKLKVNYEITETMSKEQVIKKIGLLDKKKIYEMIDSIPDAIIAEQFKQYLSEKKLEIQKSNVVEQINKFWSKMTTRASPSQKTSKLVQ